MRRGVLTKGQSSRTRRALLVILSTVLVAAVLVAVSATVRPDRIGPSAPAAAQPAPGRIVYAGGYENSSLVLAPALGSLTPLLGAGEAGNDCQPATRGDTVVWVTDRSGTGESLMWRQGVGPARLLLDRPGWRLKHPALSPDGAWLAFTSWRDGSNGYGSEDWCRQDQRVDDYPPPGADPDATPSVWLVRTDGTGLRRLAAGAGWASWSPDGTEIAYEQGRRIHRIPVQPGGRAVQVDTGAGEARRPAWEPLGGPGHGRIAFITADGEGLETLKVVPAQGGAARQLAKGGGSFTVSDVAWAPDATSLLHLSGTSAYRVDPAKPCEGCPGDEVAFDYDGFESVGWYTPAGGAPTVLLTKVNSDYRHLESVLPQPPLDRLDLLSQDLTGSADYEDPAFSPDGLRVAFVRTKYVGEGVRQVDIMVGDPADLAHAVRLAGQGLDPGLDRSRPAWSPDGTKLAFTQQEPGCTVCLSGAQDSGEVSVADISVGADKAKLLLTVPQLTRAGQNCISEELDPTWSADGSRIAFSRASRCSDKPRLADVASRIRHIWSVDATTGKDQQDLTAVQCGDRDCPVADERPAYAPNGSELAFSRALLTVEQTGTPTGTPTGGGGGAPAQRIYHGVLTMGGDGHGCRIVVPWTGACPNILPAAGPPQNNSPFRQPQAPTWSPDGRQLAFDTQVPYGDGTSSRIGIADARTGEGRLLPARRGSDQMSATWQPTADLDVTLTAAQPQVPEGATTALTLTVTNLGPAAAEPTGTELALPPGLEAVGTPEPSQGSCTAAPFGCALGRLTAGTTATVHVTAKATALGAQTSTATARTRLVDPRPDNNRAETSVTVLAPKLPDPAVTARVTPASVPVGEEAAIEFTVRNQGVATAYGVTLTPTVPPGLRVVSSTPPCPATGCSLGTLTAGAEAKVTLAVTSETPLTATVLGTVTSEGQDADPSNNTATATLTVGRTQTRLRADPAVTVTLDPPTAYVGGTVDAHFTVRNLGHAPATGVTLVTALPPDTTVVTAPAGCTLPSCPIGTLAPGAETTVTLVLRPTASHTGTVTGTLTTTGDDELTANDTAQATLTVLQPAVVLSPPLGPPGIVTLAHGTRFPPGAEVLLRWSAGVTAAAAPVVVAADGTFTAPMLVMVQDTLGPRDLLVTPAAAGPPAFGEVKAGFRVVPGVLQPSQYQQRR